MNWLTNIPVSTRDKERTKALKEKEEAFQIHLVEAKRPEPTPEPEKPKINSAQPKQTDLALEIALFGAPMGLFKR